MTSIGPNLGVPVDGGALAHPGGCFRRLISLDHRGPGRVVGWIEDDFHHFGATIVHEDMRVKEVRVNPVRVPWSTCMDARLMLQPLVGARLIERPSEIGRLIDMRLQCTHLFDLVALMMVHASTRRADRTYAVVIPDRVTARGKGTARLYQDDALVMQWHLDGESIVEPDSAFEQSLGLGFREWTESLPAQESEFATIMRRALLVSGGRYQNFDHIVNAAALGLPPVCHTFRHERSASALRVLDSVRNYEGGDAGMLGRRQEIP